MPHKMASRKYHVIFNRDTLRRNNAYIHSGCVRISMQWTWQATRGMVLFGAVQCVIK